MLSLACLVLTALPQGEVHGRPSRIVLPDRPARQPAEPQKASATSQDAAFHEAVLQLRRSLLLPPAKEAAIALRIGERFDAVPERCIALLPRLDADQTHGAMVLLRRFGGPEQAKELEYHLLTRSLGSATEITVRTMAALARETARERLFACLTAARAAVRKYAAVELAQRVTVEDVERLIVLSRMQDQDVQMKALRLLGHVPPVVEARERLLQTLGEDPPLAAVAVEALVRHGAEPAEDLQEILRAPARGRKFGYAALALVGIEAANPGTELVTGDMVPFLREELDVPDPFQRCAVALALAGIAWRSDDVTGEPYRDRDVIDRLVDVAAPTRYVEHLALLQGHAAARLALLAGRDFGARQVLWREWWESVRKSGDFVGGRRHVAVTEANAPHTLLTFSGAAFDLRFRGEAIAAPKSDAEALDLILAPSEMVTLVSALESHGFMRTARLGDLRDPRSLEIHVAGAVARTDPRTAAPVLDRMQAEMLAALQGREWQIYRDPVREPDPEAFWRAERRWLEQHTDAAARRARLKDRIVAWLPHGSGSRFELALTHLAAMPDLGEILTEEDGLAMAAAARGAKAWNESTWRLLELALLAPGDRVWRELLAVAEERDAAADSDRAVSRVFALLGTDRLLESVSSGSLRVRIAAMDEIAGLGDLRATEALVAAATSETEPLELRRTAIYALGRIGAFDARAALLPLADDPDLAPVLRRTTWVALARIGGEEVFGVLERAFPSPDEADRRAVVQALGELRHPAAAQLLADIWVLRFDDSLGALAFECLRRHGDRLSAPALRQHLEHANADVRRESALLLAEFQDPAALPELMGMLLEDVRPLRAVAAIAGITGLDLTSVNDRADRMRTWFASNRLESQGAWLLSALEQQRIPHTLRLEDLAPGAGTLAVPELCRLVVELEQPHLRALAGRMLRVSTGEDYGLVTPLMPEAQRIAICDRYRFLHDQVRAADGR